MYDNRVFSLLAALGECLCRKIDENGLPKTCFCGIIAGSAPYDATGIGDCENDGCGQAWVRLVTSYPSMSPGVADVRPNNCGAGIGVDVEIGMLRCISIEENGGAIEAEEMIEATQLQIADMLTMQQAIRCCNAVDPDDIVVGQYIPIGPDGGLVGGSWRLSALVL